MITVVVVHKGTTDPGRGFIECAQGLGRFKPGRSSRAHRWDREPGSGIRAPRAVAG
jgi:hypothetical protein